MAAQKKQDVIVEENAVYMLRAGTPVYLKTADICAMTGKSNQWVGQLVSQGVLNKRNTPHGALFDLSATVRAYCDMLETRARPAEDKAQAAAEKERVGIEISIKRAKAIRATLEAKELQGKMHRADDVARITEDLIYTIRGMLLALPGRLAIEAANLTDPNDVSALIRDEVYHVMEELSHYKYDVKKYEALVRQRLSWEMNDEDGADDD